MKSKVLIIMVFFVFFAKGMNNYGTEESACHVYLEKQKDNKSQDVKPYTVTYKSQYIEEYSIWTKCKVSVTFNYKSIENQFFYQDKINDIEMVLTPFEVDTGTTDKGYAYKSVAALNKKTGSNIVVTRSNNFLFVMYLDKNDEVIKKEQFSEEKLYETWLDRTSDLADKINQH